MSGDEKEEYELEWGCGEEVDDNDCLERGSGTGMDYGGFKKNELGP